MDDKLLKNEEKAVFSLRSLYKRYGYLPYKMSKFEEYELYARNKDFLVSDRIITFNDTNGKLMALKPDVTLSIIKNGEDAAGCKQKVCYDENVYRVSGSTHQYKEIMQTGLECIGSIDLYDIFEVVRLAAESLSLLSSEFVLDISHLGILSALLNEVSGDEEIRRAVAKCLAEKNEHDLRRICEEQGIGEEKTEEVCGFVSIYGAPDSVIGRLAPICESEAAKDALAELSALCALLKTTPFADRIFVDFSIVNDMNYYNGFVFKGFLNGVYEGVLAGGQYDRLMEKMGRKSGAIGFGVYLDLLDTLSARGSEYDVDVLLLYGEETPADEVAARVQALAESGRSVSAQKAVPDKLRYRELIRLGEGAKA